VLRDKEFIFCALRHFCYLQWQDCVPSQRLQVVRAFTECVSLNSCDLSRENVCQKDLMLAKAGLLKLTE